MLRRGPAALPSLLVAAQPAPTSKVAYFGLSKNLRGNLDPGAISQHTCQVEGVSVQMMEEGLALVLEVSSNAPCDELARHFNGRLTARWQMTLRRAAIPFGTHAGEWQLRDGAGAVT